MPCRAAAHASASAQHTYTSSLIRAIIRCSKDSPLSVPRTRTSSRATAHSFGAPSSWHEINVCGGLHFPSLDNDLQQILSKMFISRFAVTKWSGIATCWLFFTASKSGEGSTRVAIVWLPRRACHSNATFVRSRPLFGNDHSAEACAKLPSPFGCPRYLQVGGDCAGSCTSKSWSRSREAHHRWRRGG